MAHSERGAMDAARASDVVQPPPREDPWRLNDIARARQLREDARRPLCVNLAEGLQLSEFLASFTGAARR